MACTSACCCWQASACALVHSSCQDMCTHACGGGGVVVCVNSEVPSGGECCVLTHLGHQCDIWGDCLNRLYDVQKKVCQERRLCMQLPCPEVWPVSNCCLMLRRPHQQRHMMAGLSSDWPYLVPSHTLSCNCHTNPILGSAAASAH